MQIIEFNFVMKSDRCESGEPAMRHKGGKLKLKHTKIRENSDGGKHNNLNNRL